MRREDERQSFIALVQGVLNHYPNRVLNNQVQVSVWFRRFRRGVFHRGGCNPGNGKHLHRQVFQVWWAKQTGFVHHIHMRNIQRGKLLDGVRAQLRG